MAMVPFVDIYHGQGNVDFVKMASTGVKGVLCKVNEGTAVDPKWQQYAHDARAAGLQVGPYLYIQTASTSPAERQADVFVQQIAQAGPPLMQHMFDMEWSGANGVGRPGPLVDYYHRVTERADGQLGRKGSIYTIRSFWHDYTGNSPDFVDHDLIFAVARPGTPPTNAALWEAWVNNNGGLTPSRYYPVDPWPTYGATQFAVPNGVGGNYGVQTSALDMDLCKPDVWARWTGQPEDDMSAADVTAINQHTDQALAASAQAQQQWITAFVADTTFRNNVMSAVTAVFRSGEFPAAIARSNIDEAVWANAVGQALVAKVNTLPTADEIAQAVVAALPPSGGGTAGPSLDEITQAVKDVVNATSLSTP